MEYFLKWKVSGLHEWILGSIKSELAHGLYGLSHEDQTGISAMACKYTILLMQIFARSIHFGG